ncbi:hypothetical protein HOLleu_38049 [Holothuria leucospilota]|uniref:Endonuclease/exonuclease/phosphatase domain-containing protein n=1 Tax=Holothuria leucospilota TaxID=206669 RepID=A0A9Q0YKE2_HOLLE|nr:hypothetical protein HOLleu_38049 [Holothuria leucospilota]
MSANKGTFEYAYWEVKFQQTELNILGVYRPPYSHKNQRTIPQFFGEFFEVLSTEISLTENTFIMGDFNIHVDVKDDSYGSNLTESMEAFGFDQLVYFETHDRGHTLDHMYAPEISDIKVTNCYAGSYISDHCFVLADLSLRKDDVMEKTIKTRCFKKLDLIKFCEILDFDDLSDVNDLDCLIEAVDVKTVKALDQLIPVTTMRITERKKSGLMMI